MNISTNEEYIEYRDSYGNNQIARQAFIESLGEQFKQRCRESDGADSPETIIDDLKINYRTFRTWLERYPVLKEHYIQGKIILAGKMRTNIIRRKFDPANSPRFIGDLNPEYYEIFAKYEKIKQVADQQPSIVNVIKKDYTPDEYKKKAESVDASQE